MDRRHRVNNEKLKNPRIFFAMVTMDFSNESTASIDFSPTAQAKNITLVLEEQELANASYQQMERFFRVWYLERHDYAPNLKTLNIVLRPSVNAMNEITMLGVQRFIKHYKELRSTVPTTIYMDNWSALDGRIRREFANEPVVILRT